MLPNTMYNERRKKFTGNKRRNGKITIITPTETNRPLKTPPSINPKDNSKGDSEGIKVSTILPLTFETSIEVEVFAKEF